MVVPRRSDDAVPEVKQEIDDIFERWAVDEGELAVAKTAAAEQDLATIAAEILAVTPDFQPVPRNC